jgi:hypothetical protein
VHEGDAPSFGPSCSSKLNGMMTRVANEIAALPGISSAVVVTGLYDVIADIARCRTCIHVLNTRWHTQAKLPPSVVAV